MKKKKIEKFNSQYNIFIPKRLSVNEWFWYNLLVGYEDHTARVNFNA